MRGGGGVEALLLYPILRVNTVAPGQGVTMVSKPKSYSQTQGRQARYKRKTVYYLQRLPALCARNQSTTSDLAELANGPQC